MNENKTNELSGTEPVNSAPEESGYAPRIGDLLPDDETQQTAAPAPDSFPASAADSSEPAQEDFVFCESDDNVVFDDPDSAYDAEQDFAFNAPPEEEDRALGGDFPIDMMPAMAEDAAGDYAAPRQPRSDGSRRRKALFIVLTALFLVLAIAAIAVFSYIYFVIHPYASYDRILPNVYCAGINLGGMTQEEAQEAIEDALRYTDYSVDVILPDGQYTFAPDQEGVTLNGAAVAHLAYNYGRSDTSAYGMYKAYKLAEDNEYLLSAQTGLSYSTENIRELAVRISTDTYIAATDSTLSYDESSHTVTVTPGTPGRVIDSDTIYNAVCNAFDRMDFSDITLSYETIDIDLDALRSLCMSAADYTVTMTEPVVTSNIISHTIEVTIGTLGWTLDADELYAMAMDSVESGTYASVSLTMESVEPGAADITAAYEDLVSEPSDPYYEDGNVYAGKVGYTLDLESAETLVASASYGEHLSIAMTEVEPTMTVEELQSVLFRDQLSSYSTAHTVNANRTTNLTLACQAIDGTIINPGEIFSFNSVVGERTAAKGYKSATVYVGTDSVEELGGGVCQVASTIYDAALYAEMEITSRACHTFFVTYVPGGLDATIYWGSLDFAFRNSTSYPIRINASVSNGYVNISIDGTKTNDHVVKLTSTQLSSTPYTTVYEYSSSLPAGTQQETTSPYTGYVYEAYQYIYDGSGNLLETNYLGKSTYKKRDQVITIGTG